MDRDTALSVLKEFSRDMYKNYDLFGNPILCIKTEKFEAIRKKYLDGHKVENEPDYIPVCPRGFTDCVWDPAYIQYHLEVCKVMCEKYGFEEEETDDNI